MRHRKHFVYMMILSLFTVLLGCSPGLYGTKIGISSYSPTLTGDFSDYRGQKIYLMNFDNQAGDTTLWYYYSPDKNYTYADHSLIHNYFWYAFQKALLNMGMDVSTASWPNPQAPGLWMTLKSITENKFQGQVHLQKYGNPFFIKIYTVVMEPPGTEQRTPENLEKRAYDMTNRLIESILNDPEFKHAFLKAAAELSARK